MPQVAVGGLTGSAQIDVSDASLLGKNKLGGLTSAFNAMDALPKPVTDPTFKDAKFGAAFEKSTIPLENNTVDVKASVNSILAVARASDTPLFGKDDYDALGIAGNDCWISFELDTLLSTSVAVPLSNGFGVSFGVSTAPTFATYVLIPGADAPGTTLQQALGKALNAFSILDSAAEVLELPENVICISDIAGTVKVGGSWSLPLSVNQLSLADAKLPFNADVSVSPALTVSVAGSIALTSEFSVRFRRTAANRLRAGLYKKKGSTFKASFTAGAGLGADLGTTDLINKFFTAVGPEIDKGSLPSDDFGKIHQVLKDSIDRSLAISLNAACSASHSDEAAFVYELDVAIADQATKDAINAALMGDWTDIAGLPNARKIRNVITETVETTFTLTVNLLGIYNYRSVADFVRSMQVIKDSENGSVLITDKTTATRIMTASTPLAADPDRLRAALYEGFMATATYKGLMTGMGAQATFGSTQNFFLYNDSMGYRQALKQLNAGLVLGVMPLQVKSALPAIGNKVSHARFAGSCDYSNDDVLRFFFSDISTLTPRTAADLKHTGRTVLASLLDPQDTTDQKRIAALESDEAWAQMDENPARIKPPFSADWLDITEWAEAIAKVGPILARTIEAGKNVQGDPTADPAFMKQRGELAAALDDATHKTHAAFELAFPVCAMATLAGRTPGVPPPVFEASWDGQAIFTNKKPQQLAAGAGAGSAKE